VGFRVILLGKQLVAFVWSFGQLAGEPLQPFGGGGPDPSLCQIFGWVVRDEVEADDPFRRLEEAFGPVRGRGGSRRRVGT
jgi:hypothetical protein